MIRSILLLCAVPLFCAFGQQTFVHNSDYYKDRTLNYTDRFFQDGIYPKNLSEFNLITAINDSSKQYYTVTEVLFKKHLFEIKGDGFSINISPIISWSYGRDLADTMDRNLFRNTRGVYVDGTLGKNFSFSSEFHENQARYAHYQSDFYAQHGELYPNTQGYYQQNAVVPGEARTKPFKDDGFDYAFATGYIAYRPHKNVLLTGGNSSFSIGEGYRTMLYSSNHGYTPGIRIDWKISNVIKFMHVRSRHLNLLRRVATGSAESYYEPKSFVLNYLTYQPINGLGISLFEGNQWSRGDSIVSTYAPAASFIPIPFVQQFMEPDRAKRNSIFGLSITYSGFKSQSIYGQLVFDDLAFDNSAFQLGYKIANPFGIDQFFFQAEYNYAPSGFYENPTNARLNYTNYNMPIAHILGNNFSEFLVRSNYEWKRAYGELLLTYSDRGAQSHTPLLPFSSVQSSDQRTFVFLSSIELGYRFNRKMNLCAFGQLLIRTDNTKDLPTSIVSVGLKTAIKNQVTLF